MLPLDPQAATIPGVGRRRRNQSGLLEGFERSPARELSGTVPLWI